VSDLSSIPLAVQSLIVGRTPARTTLPTRTDAAIAASVTGDAPMIRTPGSTDLMAASIPEMGPKWAEKTLHGRQWVLMGEIAFVAVDEVGASWGTRLVR
jgi:hypothetical protein